MLLMCWLMFRGSWQQAVINYETTSAVMQASMAWLYLSGLVFAVLAALIIAYELWKLVTGRLDDAELVGVAESDDMPHGNPQ
jgi:TRAP-type C4-dicarboxylate transport system permease small subunit